MMWKYDFSKKSSLIKNYFKKLFLVRHLKPYLGHT